MNKKIYIIIYGIICTVGLMPMFSSCDSDEQSSERGAFSAEQLQLMNQMDAIRDVLNCLADVETLSDDFYQQTYTPTYGKVLDDANPFVRKMMADDSESAYREFAMMVGSKDLITPTADGYRVDLKFPTELAKLANRELFGKLTYHQGDGLTRTAYVDVDIPNMPKLQRIDFVPSKMWGDNDDVPQSAYKLGALVYFQGKEIDGKTRGRGYWLCVRPYDGFYDGILVHLNEGYDANFAYLFKSRSGYSWTAYFKGDAGDPEAYMYFLYCYKELIDLDKEYLLTNSPTYQYYDYTYGKWVTSSLGEVYIKEILPDRFLRNGNVYDGDKPAWIITDTYEGNYHWGMAGWWSVCKHMEIPAHSKNGAGEFSGWNYDNANDWSKQSEKTYFYTISVLHFKDSAPDGCSLVYDPAPSE